MPKGSPKNPNSDDRWTSVGSFGVGGDRATVYVNMAEAYKQEDGGWELQIWSTWQSPQSDPKGEYTDAEGHVSLHCSTKEAGASPMEQIYNSTGAQIDSNTDYVPSRAIPPNSIAEVLYDGFCASNGVSN